MTETSTRLTCDLCLVEVPGEARRYRVTFAVPWENPSTREPVEGLVTSQGARDLCEACAAGCGLTSLFDGTAKAPVRDV